MVQRILGILNIRRNEWRIVAALFCILAINTIVYELTDVISTAGFVSSMGAEQIPWLWIVDMLVTLMLASMITLVIDRWPCLRLLSYMIPCLAAIYFLFGLLIRYAAFDRLIYPTLYILADQQFVIFPLVFWIIVNDVFAMVEAKRLIPLIGVGAALGSITGNALAAASAAWLVRQQGDNTYLLIASGVLLLVSLIILRLTFRHREIPRPRRSTEEGSSFRETLNLALDYFRNLPLFRYLSLSIFMVCIALTIIEYYFLHSVELAFETSLEFQLFYGLYKVVLITALVLFQGFVTGRLLERIPLRNALIVFPVTMVASSGLALAIPGIVGATVARFVARFSERAWDEPARKSTLALVPDERRGRVSTLLDTYLPAVSTIAGSLVLLGLLYAGPLLELSSKPLTWIYLALALILSGCAVWMILRARASYSVSLLNWRLSRSRRKSVLDGLKF